MPSPFKTRIRSALADANLQAALDANAERRIRARRQAFADLPLETLRQRAHAVRAEVIANLDSYLEQFIARAQANGLIVHRAATAAEAVQIVLDLARQQGEAARSPKADERSDDSRQNPPSPDAQILIAKSKTMISEEIHLNAALEAAGMRVVETDLGEYIVQLRGEPPAHIITPAVHLRRGDVARLFHEKLGMPLTEDIPTMTNLARRLLRQVFLSAQIGLSGVNFGVAESGTLVIVTNEGNGRMVTTVPRIHIALMGIERLVPSFEELALMLTLLPRSATGQKLSVYVSLLHSPRRPGDADGPQERHLILLDNGRSALRGSPLEEILYCIRCGACLNVCPVFREIGGHAYASVYAGPMGSVLSPGLFGPAAFGELARASTLCGACGEACPVAIDLPKLLLRVRAGLVGEGYSSDGRRPGGERPNAPAYLQWGLRFFSWVAVIPPLYRLMQHLAGLAARLAAPRSAWLRLPAWTGWGYSKDFPAPATRPFLARRNPRRRENSGEKYPSHPADLAAAAAAEAAPFSKQSVEQFEREWLALGGTFTACAEDELGEVILAWLHAHEVKHIAAWDEGLPEGVLERLRQSGILVNDEAKAARVGLSGALAAVAETGTLIIPAGPGRPLTASLLPEIHLAVLRRETIYANLAQALSLSEVREASAVVLVSGPSRTADIEMTLTIGVHGPGEVHVFCV